MNDNIRKYGSFLLVVMLVLSMSVAFVGIGAADKSADLNDGERYWVGQVLDYENETISDNEDMSITSAEVVELGDDGGFVTELSPDDGNISIDTADYDASSYELRYDYEDTAESTEGSETVEFELAEQRLSVDPADVRVDNEDDSETTFEIDSNRNSFDVNVSVDNLSDSDLAQVFSVGETEYTEDDVEDGQLQVDASDDIDVDFEDIDADEYDFNFEVVDTGVSDNASVTVAEPGDALVEFEESYVNVAEGDYEDITLTFEETDSAYVVIGDEDDMGYEIKFDVEDTDEDGEVTVVFNSYLAGQSGNDVDLEDIIYVHEDSNGEVTVESETELDDRQLSTGDYDMSVFADDRDGDETDVGSLDITERSSTGVTSMVMPGDTDVDDYDDVSDAVSESDTVAENDALVLEVEMNGIYGFFDDSATLSSEATENNGLYAEILRDAPNTNDHVDLSTADIYTNSDEGVFYVVVDVTDEEFRIDADYDVEVGLTDDNPYVDEDEDEVFELAISTEERDTEFNNKNSDDVVEVEQGDTLEVTADTNVADGTERRFTVRQTGEDSFVKNVDVTSEDGVFTAEFEEERLSTGSEFTVQVREETERVDAVMVESTGTDDEDVDDGTDDEDVDDGTDDTDTDDGTDDTDTDDGTDDTDTDDGTDDGDVDTTDDDTPGFGALVALVALIGAALLALRRNN